eukprot:GFYU01057671.1.p3 GENE.GFYU01057671.1~~GFYU01057671.1.p3  ORF type:complete len:140 (+),score=1.24 GFYU01057671.1:475-894(+)
MLDAGLKYNIPIKNILLIVIIVVDTRNTACTGGGVPSFRLSTWPCNKAVTGMVGYVIITIVLTTTNTMPSRAVVDVVREGVGVSCPAVGGMLGRSSLVRGGNSWLVMGCWLSGRPTGWWGCAREVAVPSRGGSKGVEGG